MCALLRGNADYHSRTLLSRLRAIVNRNEVLLIEAREASAWTAQHFFEGPDAGRGPGERPSSASRHTVRGPCGDLLFDGCPDFPRFLFHQPAPQLEDVVRARDADWFAHATRLNDDNVFSVFQHHVAMNLIDGVSWVGENEITACELAHGEVVIWRFGSQ